MGRGVLQFNQKVTKEMDKHFLGLQIEFGHLFFLGGHILLSVTGDFRNQLEAVGCLFFFIPGNFVSSFSLQAFQAFTKSTSFYRLLSHRNLKNQI